MSEINCGICGLPGSFYFTSKDGKPMKFKDTFVKLAHDKYVHKNCASKVLEASEKKNEDKQQV